MNLSRVALPAVFLASASAALAHPGHDGHDLTWDFQHLAANPVATLLCAAVLAGAAWGLSLGFSAIVARRQSLRKSADNSRR
jgi:hypothetical protein